MDDAENGLPRSFMKPSLASSAATSRRDRWCPFGERRRSRLASRTSSGFYLVRRVIEGDMIQRFPEDRSNLVEPRRRCGAAARPKQWR
jgi:hypothetical protein